MQHTLLQHCHKPFRQEGTASRGTAPTVIAGPRDLPSLLDDSSRFVLCLFFAAVFSAVSRSVLLSTFTCLRTLSRMASSRSSFSTAA
eukprot:m.106506 g.106506  ORF g.106506 m.106506 type:complete len:87 (+) comp13304_c0_seq1:472-732(+)